MQAVENTFQRAGTTGASIVRKQLAVEPELSLLLLLILPLLLLLGGGHVFVRDGGLLKRYTRRRGSYSGVCVARIDLNRDFGAFFF